MHVGELMLRSHNNVDFFEPFDMRRSLNLNYRFGHNRFEFGARGESRGDFMIRALPGIKRK